MHELAIEHDPIRYRGKMVLFGMIKEHLVNCSEQWFDLVEPGGVGGFMFVLSECKGDAQGEDGGEKDFHILDDLRSTAWNAESQTLKAER